MDSLHLPSGFGWRAGHDKSVCHVTPYCGLVVFTLIEDGVGDRRLNATDSYYGDILLLSVQ